MEAEARKGELIRCLLDSSLLLASPGDDQSQVSDHLNLRGEVRPAPLPLGAYLKCIGERLSLPIYLRALTYQLIIQRSIKVLLLIKGLPTLRAASRVLLTFSC